MNGFNIVSPTSWLRRSLGIALIILLVLISSLSLIAPPGVQAQDGSNPPDNSPDITPDATPPEVSVSVEPDKDAEITSFSGKITVNIPKGAVSAVTDVSMREYPATDSTGTQTVALFELNAKETSSERAVNRFNKELEITINHTPEELSGLDVDSLYLYYLDEKTQQWGPVPSRFDRETLTLTATVNHFSYFGEQANPLQNGPGRVMAADVNLHSGTATYSYPIELPPGPGGFQPSLTLSYNSGAVDGMKNKRDVGSWVGTGWSLNPGSITLDSLSNTYYLNLSGVSYELYSISDTEYRTKPDEYFQITRSGNTWTLLDRSGNYYQFGSTTDAIQYYDSSNYYRWDLSYWKDTNGNEATISYVRDIYSNSVRSAYPEYLRYNNNLVEVHFISSYDENGSYGPVRDDNPISYGSNPVPKIMENRSLDAIEIKVSGSLIRKYTFTYNTTDRVYSSDYGGIYYAGKHMLTSITQVGADGSSTLPAITFTYQDKEVFRKTSSSQYTGNPGNPASLTWPFLTAINSGYGGSVGFTYTQIPANTTYDIWTRQAVTTKTVNSGIGSSETYTYTYTGNPAYKGANWDQEFRGWNEVKETDAAGNYVKHWFYTTGTIGGKDAEKLTGREYKTEWYSSTSTLLDTKTYDWNWVTTHQQPAGGTVAAFSGFYSPQGVAVGPDGYIYVAATGNNTIYKLSPNGTTVASWSSFYRPGYGYTYLNQPQGIAVRADGYIYIAATGNNMILCISPTGTLVAAWNNFYSPAYGSIYLSQPQGISVGTDGYVYIAATGNNKILRISSGGTLVGAWSQFYSSPYNYVNLYSPQGVAVGADGYTYIAATGNNMVLKTAGEYLAASWSSFNIPPYYMINLNQPQGVAVDADGNIYVAATGNNMLLRVSPSGTLLNAWSTFSAPPYYNPTALSQPQGVAIGPDGYIYVAATGNNIILKLAPEKSNYAVQLNKIEETIGTKTSRTEYVYDSYGNIITEKHHGDISTYADDATIHRLYFPNTTANILNRPACERVYATITGDGRGPNLKKETLYYYDGNNTSLTSPPSKGNLTRLEQYKDDSNTVSNYFTYDTYGNVLTEQDPNGSTTTRTYDTTYHTYPATMTLPVTGLSESYTYTAGTTNLLSMTDANGQTTIYEYDTFQRLIKVIKPGDSSVSPSVQYQYNNWGTLNQQHIKTITKIDAGDSLWQSQYFDGLGRVVQVHAEGEAGHTIVATTTVFNNRGLVDKEYVSQDIASVLTSYQTPDGGWKYASYTYDGLGRVITQTSADGTSVSHDYATAWQELTTNERGYKTRYYYDAFNRLTKVEELNASHQLYATTTHAYDVLGNLVQVVDNSSNTTTMTYDRLSRKTGMSDPDMGSWTYGYDSNGNLTTQTDAKSQTITMVYDALNRLTNKNYPGGSGMTNVVYSYDSTSGGNYGKGQLTAMTDAIGTTTYKYDTRGRLIEEKHTVDTVDYITTFTYDGADRTVTITYPSGETVTQSYNGRGLPYTLSGSVAGDIVTSTLYNHLGQITEINLNNGLKNIFGYYGTGGTYDTTGGYYGRLWRIATTDGVNDLMDIRHTWDAGGNLTSREDVLASETESFTYDFLDRLTAVSGPYSASYSYNQIGNVISMNGNSYTYGTKPHAVTAVGATSYAYDANGNMTTRDSQTITWDVENRPVSVANGGTATFVYDGNGNRAQKTEGGEIVLYINRYYERNLTTGEVTTYYYLGGRLVAMKQDNDLTYLHQDHLTGTALATDVSGDQVGTTVKYLPYGETRTGAVPTDKLFTGQRLDETGLYYYGARYYDPTIGRFISADSVIQSFANPQTLNRYSYCVNNPLKYVDPTGYNVEICGFDVENMTEAGLMYLLTLPPAMQKQIVAAFKAWESLCEAAPEMTEYLLDDSTPTTPILISSTLGSSGSSMNGYIFINSSLLRDIGDAASTIGHEAFHRIADLNGFTDNSAYEEACAWSIGAAVDKALGSFNWWASFLCPYDSMTPDKDFAWVDNYVYNADWQPGGWESYPGVKAWREVGVDNNGNPTYDWVFNPYPNPWEGGYEKMNALYVAYYPKQ